ncbi:MAG: retroviral-like aspartic protease family protein [Armatimonadota bacterium]
MPILHLQFQAAAKGDAGQDVPVPPAVALHRAGPCLKASVMLLESMAQALLAEGKEVPEPVSGMVLIDTGASGTCVDEGVARQLRLPARGTGQMSSASEASAERNLYPVTIDIVGFPLKFNVMRAMSAELAPQGLVALIGRDALSGCMLVYNGLSGEVTLAR